MDESEAGSSTEVSLTQSLKASFPTLKTPSGIETSVMLVLREKAPSATDVTGRPSSCAGISTRPPAPS